MLTRLLLVTFLCLLPAIARACLCPLDTQSWWDFYPNVALVQITEVKVGQRVWHTGMPCGEPESCEDLQVATYRLVESFKGSFAHARELASGYAGGDCGVPLVAGAYYVVFLPTRSAKIGFCNAAGPYPRRREPPEVVPTYLAAFLESLRKAQTVGTPVATRPKPMPYDTLGER